MTGAETEAAGGFEGGHGPESAGAEGVADPQRRQRRRRRRRRRRQNRSGAERRLGVVAGVALADGRSHAGTHNILEP